MLSFNFAFWSGFHRNPIDGACYILLLTSSQTVVSRKDFAFSLFPQLGWWFWYRKWTQRPKLNLHFQISSFLKIHFVLPSRVISRYLLIYGLPLVTGAKKDFGDYFQRINNSTWRKKANISNHVNHIFKKSLSIAVMRIFADYNCFCKFANGKYIIVSFYGEHDLEIMNTTIQNRLNFSAKIIHT